MKLLINADDAGIDTSRNHGIAHTIDYGLVRNISVIVGQSGWDDILGTIKGRDALGVGFHFNLTAGKPLTSEHKTLTRSDGSFYNKYELFERSLLGFIDPEEIVRELTAQYQTLESAGIKPTHVDGHNHVHLLPGVREAFRDVIKHNTWVRLPFEHGHSSANPRGKDPIAVHNNAECLIEAFNCLSGEAKDIWKDKFRYADDFSGTKLTFQPSLEAFKEAISNLKGDLCELMCHPGGMAGENSARFSKLKERETERDVLTGNALKQFIENEGIQITSFKEI